MIAPLFLIFLGCAKIHKPTNISSEIPSTGSICFDGFLKIYGDMVCENKVVNDGPMGSLIFSCKIKNKNPTANFLVTDNFVSSDFFIGNLICMDEKTSIFFYQNKEI